MARHTHFADMHPALYQRQDGPQLHPYTGLGGNRHNRLTSPKALLPLGVSAAITAIIVLVYICSLSLRQKVPSFSLGRRLAGSKEGEEGKKQDLCSPERSESPSDSYAFPADWLEPILRSQYGQAESETGPSTSSTDRTAEPNGGEVSRRATTQLTAAKVAVGVKRKQKREADKGGEAKQAKFEASHGQVLPAHQPLGLEPDPLIAHVLSQGGFAPMEAFLALDGKTVAEILGALTGDPGKPDGNTVGDPQWNAGEGTSRMYSSTAAAERGAQLGRSDSEDASPIDFLNTALPESGSAFSAEGWLDEGDDFLGKPDSAGPSPPHLTPYATPYDGGGTAESKENTQIFFTSPPRSFHEGGPYTSQTPSHKQSVSAGEGAASRLVHIPTAPLATPPDHGLGTSFSEQTLGTVSSTSMIPASTSVHASLESVKEASDAGGQGEQQATVPPPLAIMGSLAVPPWFHSMYEGVAESVLKYHPFYFHPGCQRIANPPTFRLAVSSSFRHLRKVPVPSLEEWRCLMKKTEYTESDYKRLMYATERLAGYAMTNLPAFVPPESAVVAVETLGSIFLVLDALHCAAEVLGEPSKKSLWWPHIMERIKYVKHWPTERDTRLNTTARLLDLAINYYRRELRPPPRLVICLKELLFDDAVKLKFRSPSWDGFRRDIQNWHRTMFGRGGEKTQ